MKWMFFVILLLFQMVHSQERFLLARARTRARKRTTLKKVVAEVHFFCRIPHGSAITTNRFGMEGNALVDIRDETTTISGHPGCLRSQADLFLASGR